MVFTHLPPLAHYIQRHHYSFGGDQGFGYVSDVLDVLGRMHAAMMEHPALVGATFLAWQDAPGFGDLRTEITISHLPDGSWLYEEHVA